MVFNYKIVTEELCDWIMCLHLPAAEKSRITQGYFGWE